MRAVPYALLACAAPLACGDDAAPTDEHAPPPASGTVRWEQRVPALLYDIAVAPDGSVYATGGSQRFWLAKFAADGAPQWTQEGDESLGVAIVVGEDAGVYAATTTFGSLTGVRHLARFDAEGARTWILDQGDRALGELAPAPGGGVYAAGDGPDGPFFQRIDAAGAIVWTHDAPELGSIDDIAVGANGELLATGMGAAWWVQARDGDGVLLWATELGPPLPAGPFQSIAVTAGGDLKIAAMTQNEPAARGYLASLRADGAHTGLERPLEHPPTEIVQTGDILAMAYLVPPVGVEARAADDTTLWSLAPDADCWKTWALDAAPATALVALSECSSGSRIVAIQP